MELADSIYGLAPWKTLHDSDSIAIQPEPDGEIYFLNVMGGLGEHYGVGFYEGAESFWTMCKVIRGDEAPVDLLLAAGFLVSFEERSNLDQRERALFKDLSRTYRGTEWPSVRRQDPARVPWLPSAKHLPLLVELFEQTILLLGKSYLKKWKKVDEDEIFLRRKKLDGKWENAKIETNTLRAPARRIRASVDISAIAALPVRKQECELECRLIFAPIRCKNPAEASLLPMALLLAVTKMGPVVGFQLLPTEDGVDGAYASIPQALHDLLLKAGWLPSVISVRHPILLTLLTSLPPSVRTTVKAAHELPSCEMALQHLEGYLARAGH